MALAATAAKWVVPPSSDKEGNEEDEPVVSQKDTSKNGFSDKLATYAGDY